MSTIKSAPAELLRGGAVGSWNEGFGSRCQSSAATKCLNLRSKAPLESRPTNTPCTMGGFC
jgi:hypothetical protein